MDELSEHKKNKADALARDMKTNPDLAAAVARHPSGSKLTPAPKISGGPGKVINMRRVH
jgi:hypothetical protein